MSADTTLVPVPLDFLQRIIAECDVADRTGASSAIFLFEDEARAMVAAAPSIEMGFNEDLTRQTHFEIREADGEKELRVPLTYVEINTDLLDTSAFDLRFFRAENGRWKVSTSIGPYRRSFAMPVTNTFVSVVRKIQRAAVAHRAEERQL